MTLTSLEHEFLLRLSIEPWISPPLFDHSLVVRLVEAGYVQSVGCRRCVYRKLKRGRSGDEVRPGRSVN
jgi:hypothetical protein